MLTFEQAKTVSADPTADTVRFFPLGRAAWPGESGCAETAAKSR